MFLQSSVLTTRHAINLPSEILGAFPRLLGRKHHPQLRLAGTSASVALTFSWKAAIASCKPADKKATIKMGHPVIVEMKNV